jgi:large-conductance mechanosensitive channel
MVKFIIFSIAFFFLVRYINRLFLPSNKRQQNFNPFTGHSGNKRKNFDEIEEADYEDLSNKDN